MDDEILKKFSDTYHKRMRMNNDALLRNEIPWIMDFIRTNLAAKQDNPQIDT